METQDAADIGAIEGEPTVPPAAEDDSGWTTLESPTRLSQSILWDLQREYFERQGIAAWSRAVVPHFITSNAFIAHTYVRQALAFLRDATAAGMANDCPLYIIEIAAGSGRFAHYFLHIWSELTAHEPDLAGRIRYVLTDVATSLVDFWQQHPQLTALADTGSLDFACFDLEKDDPLQLVRSGIELKPGSLEAPLVAIANYAFNSVRQDAFAVSDGQLLECRLVLETSVFGEAAREAPGLDDLHFSHDYRSIELPYYDEPALDNLLREYQETLGEGHFLFPVGAFRAVRALAALSHHGLLLLSADMGTDRLAGWRGSPPPQPSRHGSIALRVNYHALGHWVASLGGSPIKPRIAQTKLTVNAFLLGSAAECSPETRRVTSEVLEGLGPDAFFLLKRQLDQHSEEMAFGDLLAYLKLSHWDTRALRLSLPRLAMLATEGLTAPERLALGQAAERVWASHLHIGEAQDLAFEIGTVLASAGLPLESRAFFVRSLERYGEHTATVFNLALCHFRLGEPEESKRLSLRVLELDADNRGAQELLQQLETGVEPGVDSAPLTFLEKPGHPASAPGAYRDNLDHLRAELALLNRRLEHELTRWRATHPRESLQKELMGFQLSDLGADTALHSLGSREPRELLLDDAVSDPIANLAAQAGLHAERARQARGAGVELRLLDLAERLGLDTFERNVVLLTLAPELDQRYERLFGYLNDEMSRRWPTVELALRLFSSDAQKRSAHHRAFDPGGTLQDRRLLLISDESSPLPLVRRSRGLRLEPRIVDFLLHGTLLRGTASAGAVTDSKLAGVLEPWREAPASTPLTVGHDDLQSEIAELRAFLAGRPSPPPILSLTGPDALQTRRIASSLVAGSPLLILHGAAVAASDEAEDLIARALRETELSGAVLLVDDAAALRKEGRPAQALHRLLTAPCSQPRLLAAAEPWQLPDACRTVPMLALHLPAPHQRAREELWRRALEGLETDVDLGELAGRFRLHSTQIAGAANRLRAHALSRMAVDKPKPVTRSEIFTACRAQCLASLEGLATRIESPHSWDDLVVPPRAKEMLRSLENWLRYRHVVFEEWGFAERVAHGRGMAAMFSGSSGTGKTMAAGIIARSLDLDLYSIDLSSVVSKYIGETEKNLAKIFEAAEAANAILFFDEADALFGKRSQVKDSHDRHANIEVSYLLQRMETFAGITILATNIRGNVDSAFLRRLQVIVEFPFPSVEDRERIWQRLFPERVPQSQDVDLEFLAKQFGLSGGSIKNCAVNAALAAAADGGSVEMRHLVRAVAREMEKMGKPVGTGMFGGYERWVG